MKSTLEEIKKTVEKSTGKTIKDLKSTTIDCRRRIMERTGKIKLFSMFPFIGRKHVDNILSTEEINASIDSRIE